MNYDLTKPCSQCPFRNDIDPYLTYDRVLELEESLVRGDFPCHKTTVPVEPESEELNEDFCDMAATDDSQHCAGALILLEKLKLPSQMMRIAGRLGLYDHRKLDLTSPVFDSWEDMADCQPG